MKIFYSRFRIMLLTFTLGLASVFTSNGSLQFTNEIPANLSKIQTESPVIVFPIYAKDIPKWGGGRDGAEFEESIKQKIRK